MGNNQSSDDDPYFDPRRYTHSGLRVHEISCIRESFLKCKPYKGHVKTS